MKTKNNNNKVIVSNERYGHSVRAGKMAMNIVRKAVGKQGFTAVALGQHWPRLAGEYYASKCWPHRLSFAKGQRNNGELVLKSTGPDALEVSHAIPLLLDGINAHFGYKAVDKISIKQEPAKLNPSSKDST